MIVIASGKPQAYKPRGVSPRRHKEKTSMAFSRSLPLNHSEATSLELRNQFTGLDDKIIVLKDKVDAAAMPDLAAVPAVGHDAGGRISPGSSTGESAGSRVTA